MQPSCTVWRVAGTKHGVWYVEAGGGFGVVESCLSRCNQGASQGLAHKAAADVLCSAGIGGHAVQLEVHRQLLLPLWVL